MRKKILNALITGITALSLMPTVVLAGNDWRKDDWHIDDVKQYMMNSQYEYATFVRVGGINKIDNIVAENKMECQMLEQHLLSNGYILVNTTHKQISDEEYELMKDVFADLIIGDNLLDESKKMYSENQKLFLNREVYNCALKQAKETGTVNKINPYTYLDLELSYVLVDYLNWNAIENRGKTYTNEFINDNIKKFDEEWGTDYDKHAGYIYIYNDIDSRIVFEEQYSGTYQQIDVKGGVPLVVKMLNGYYKIFTINDVEIEQDESLLGNYKNNIFKLGASQTFDNPYTIDLTKGINEKYDLQPYNIDGNKDFRANEWKEVDPDEYKVIVDDKIQKQETKGEERNGIINIIKICLGVIGFILLIIGGKKVSDYKSKESTE